MAKRVLMKGRIICIILIIIAFSCKAADYTTVTNSCPFITFSSDGLTKVSVHKKQIKVQKVTGMVIVTVISDGAQVFTWNETQAQQYGGRTISQLYNYILALITNPC